MYNPRSGEDLRTLGGDGEHEVVLSSSPFLTLKAPPPPPPSFFSQPYYCGVGAPDTSAGGGESRSTGYLKFGHSMTDSFECDLSSLLAHEVYFYDPYVMDEVKIWRHSWIILPTCSR